MTVYSQFGYIWARNLLLANYTIASARRELTAIDCTIARVHTAWTPDKENIYRVCIDPLTGRVEVICIGMLESDSDVEGTYPSTEALPDWVKDRLAVLSIMSSKPPTQKIEGIGQRIDANTFWVVR